MSSLQVLLRRLAVVGTVAAGLFLFAAPAAAANFTVTKVADTKDGTCDADCSLREAIIAANASPGPHTINLPAGTYVLSSANNLGVSDGIGDSDAALGDLDINQNMTLIGAGAATTIIQGGPGFNDKLIEVNSKGVRDFYELNIPFTSVPAVSFSMTGVTLDGGHATEGYNRGGRGGAFSYWGVNGSTLTLDSIIVKNSVTDLGDAGGVALNSMDPNQTLPRVQILNSTITGNASRDGVGGGIYAGSGVPVLIQNSIITNNTSGVGGPGTNVNQGGGLWLYDDHTTSSTIDRTVISGNTADSAGAGNDDADGGGLYIGRTLTITNSTISGNTTDRHGGAFMLTLIANQSLSMTNVTVSGNTAAKDGGGGYHGLTFASGQEPSVTYTNVTVTNNHSNDGTATGSGGIYRSITDNGGGAGPDGHFYLRNTIVAGNHKGGGNTPSDLAGHILDLGGTSHHNLIGTGGAGGLTNGTANNIVLTGGATALLGPLANNGGPTLTHALLGDSPALDAGDSTIATANDQRGATWARILDAADADATDEVDIGALEMHPAVADSGTVTMLQDTSINNYPVYLGDTDLGIDTFTAVSSNPAILPNPTISGTGGTRTLTLTPVAGQFGTVTVTLTTTDLYNGVSQTMTDTFTVTVVPRPNLTVTKAHTNPWKQGDTGKTYTVTVSNLAGAGPTLGVGNTLGIDPKVTVVDTLPVGLTATAISGTGWNCVLGTLTCDRSDVLAAGASYPAITVTATVADNADPTVTNSVTVSGNADNTPGNNSASDPTPIVQTPDLTVAKSHSGNYEQGQFGATYTLTVSNGGTNTGPTSGAYSVTDTLPTGITFVSGTSADPGWSCSAAGQVVTCTRSTALASPGSTAITITVNVARDAGSPFNTTASVSGGGEVGSRLTNNTSAADSIIVTPMPDLTVALAEVGTFRQGQSAGYTVTVTNSGFAPTNGTTAASVTVTLPVGLSASAMTGTNWTCDVPTRTCTSMEVIAGSGTNYPTITLTVQVADTAPASVTTTASVTDAGQIWTANDTASKTTTVIQAPDLAIVKSHTGDFTQSQMGATYTLTVSNKAGAGPTTGIITVTDPLPSGLTPVSGVGTGWTCTVAGQNVACTNSAVLNAGSSYSPITLTVDVAAGAPPAVTNTAAVNGGGETGSTVTDNSSSNPTTINQLADLTVTSSHTDPFHQGQTGATYTLTVTNIGTGQTDGSTITVTDTLPAGLTPTAVTSAGATCSYTGQTVTCTRATALLANDPYTITITVNVAGNAAASVTNTAMIGGGGEPAGKTGNNTASDVTNITPKPDLTVTKTHAGNFRQGATGTYTIRVTNSGFAPTDATAVTVTDTLPAGLTLGGMSGTGWDCTAGTSCTRSDALAAAGSFPDITLTVSVANNAAASVTNTASVSGGGEVVTNNNSASDPTTITQNADLTVTKTHTGTWTQGDTGRTYTIQVGNPGDGPTDAPIVVTDSVPAGLTPSAASGTGWTCSISGQDVTCTRSTALAVGGTSDITLTVNVDAYAPPTLTNTVTVSGGGEINTTNNSASDPTTLVQRPDLTLTKSHTGNFTQGQNGAAYTITVTNSGTGLTSGTVTVTDTLPASLTPKTATAPADWACTISGQAVTCTTDVVKDHGQSYSPITLTIDVAPLAPTAETNTATVAGGSDTNTGNNSFSDPTTIIQAPDLTIAKTHTGTFQRGQKGATYTITVGNGGGLPTGGTVTVTDTLPTGMTPKGSSGTGWSCTISGQTYTCTTAAVLAAGQSYPAITLTVDVAADAAAAITNTATVSGGSEINTANDSASDPTTVVPESDLSITKTHTGNFTQGQAATYTLVVHNGGGGPTRGTATVTDTLPTGLTYTGFTGTNWTCTAAGQVVTCTSTDEVIAGSNYPALNLTVTVADSVPPSITNTADVSGGGELNTANNTCLDGAAVVQLVDLTITKSHGSDFRQGQKAAAYTLTVTNNGIAASRSLITVVDTLPAGLVYAGFTGTDWTCTYDSATRTVTCTRSADLAPGAAAASVITITVDVADDAAPSVTNSVTVSGGGDYTGVIKEASDVTKVIQVADLVIAKSLNGTLRQGRTAEYTLVVSNVGPGVTEGTVTVTDTMPTGVTVTGYSSEDASWSCTFGPPAITCLRSDPLAANLLAPIPPAYPAIRVQVLVLHDAPSSVTNQATVSGGGEIKLTNDTATHVAAVTQAADLTISKQHHGNFIRGVGGLYTLTVRNVGTGPTDAPVTVTDTLPAGMTILTVKGIGWTCDVATVTCTRSSVLSPGGSYPPIALAVRVAADAAPNLVNQASVSGGGEAKVDNNTASDPTQTVPKPPGGGGGTPATSFVSITAQAALTREGSVTVSGSANPGADVRVNGRTVHADENGSWSATVSLVEGPNVITASNGSASDSVTVTRDTTAPPLSLSASQTRTEQATVELTATSEEGARVEIDGKPVSRLTVPLALGENSFSATATDRAGNVARATVKVVRVPGGSPPPPPPPPGPPTPPPVPPVPPIPPQRPPFSDVDGHWARGAIDRMVAQGVVQGYEDNSFRPEAQVSRLEFAVMVARLLKLTPTDQPLHFGDSASIPDWAQAQFAAAAQAGIITGRPDGTFDPNASVNRAEVAVMLVRAMKFKGMSVAPGTGRFVDDLPAWAREQVLSAARYGLVTGYTDGSFRAGNTATRAESVTMLDRLFTLLSQR